MWVMDYRRRTRKRHGFESKQKITLAMGSKPEDTLKRLWLKTDTSGYMWLSDSSSKSRAESELESSDAENSVVSGPSSPSAASRTWRCRNCEILFTTMRRQRPQKKKHHHNDPASLSCDEWLLKKAWQPQRQQKSRGKLWSHLKHIRERAAMQTASDMANKAWLPCSRPHVFLQRNLNRCKMMCEKSSKRKAKSRNQQRNRSKPTWSLHRGNYQRQKKRKSSEKDEASKHIPTLDLTITSEDDLPANDNTHHERLGKVPKKRSSSDVSGFVQDIQDNCSVLESTRRVLNFDTSRDDVVVETQKPKHHHLVHNTARGKLHEGQICDAGSSRSLDDDSCEEVDAFRTPTDLSSQDMKITRKSRPSCPFGAQKNSFRTMLAALVRGNNQIIKESHQ